MKKNLLLLAVVGLALASCSSDETLQTAATSESNAISFRPAVQGMTRAADAHFSTPSDAFKVTAFPTGTTTGAYFANVVFSTTDGANFTSADKYYWPASDGKLDFYAWAPSSYSAGSGDYTSFAITPGGTIGSQPDFVYAVTKGWGKSTRTGSAGVSINFRHAESKILIQLKNTNPNLKITVNDVSIGNLRGTETFSWNGVTDGSTTTAAADANTDGQYTSGTLTYLNGTWTATSTPTSSYLITMGTDSYDDDSDAGTANVTRNVFDGASAVDRNLTATAANHEMILIPQVLNAQTTYSGTTEGAAFGGAYISVQLKIQNKANDAYIVGSASGSNPWVTAIWPLTALTWLPGHKYTYTVDLAGGGYFPNNNNDGDSALDPILEGAEIKFVTVTVDDWKEETGTVYTSGL